MVEANPYGDDRPDDSGKKDGETEEPSAEVFDTQDN